MHYLTLDSRLLPKDGIRNPQIDRFSFEKQLELWAR